MPSKFEELSYASNASLLWGHSFHIGQSAKKNNGWGEELGPE